MTLASMPGRVQAEQGFQQVRSAHDPHDLAICDDRQPFELDVDASIRRSLQLVYPRVPKPDPRT